MAQQKNESIFSYSLSRPYPFRWFTYVVAIGGAICIVLFSFVALAADGYDLDLEYTLDLNGTLDESYWFQKPPFSWFSKTAVVCQHALLTTGSTYFTSNLGFTYTLDKLWREGANGMQNRILPATAYQNSLLEDCRVLAIEIDFERRDQTTDRNNWWTWGATSASATVECSFQTALGGVKAILTTQLPSVFRLADISLANSVLLSSDVSEHADMWFGVQFTYAWYNQLPLVMSLQQIPFEEYPDISWDSGTVVLSRNPAVLDYTDLNFFYAQAFFYGNNDSFAWIRPPDTAAVWAESQQTGASSLPKIIRTVDAFGKCLYSLLLSDFGVQDETNALITPSGVKWLQDLVDPELKGKTTDMIVGRYSGRPDGIPNAINKTGPTYPINETYQLVSKDLGEPPNLTNTNSSTIFMQYLCSIPQRKGGAALFFAVLLADLVFLQAAWMLLNLAATWWLQRKYEQANYCEGCRAVEASGPKRKVSDYQLLPVNSKTDSGVLFPDDERVGGRVYARGKKINEGEET